MRSEGANTFVEGDTKWARETAGNSNKAVWGSGGVSFRDKVLRGEKGNFQNFTEDMLQDKVRVCLRRVAQGDLWCSLRSLWWIS